MAGWRGLLGALLAAVALAASGCVQRVARAPQSLEPTPVATAEAPPAPGSMLTPAATDLPEPSATLSPLPEPTPASSVVPAGTTSTPGASNMQAVSPVQRYGLFLEIDGLTEESVVRGDTIVARGRTSPDAVLSINGVVVPVDEHGSFEVLLALDPGPNFIEVVASDLEGNEETIELAVVSLPENGW